MKDSIPHRKALSGVLLAGLVAACIGSCYSSLPAGKGNAPQQESIRATIASLSQDPLGQHTLLGDGDDPAFELTPIDTNCTYYATFQSHNQKVVQNANGIFMTYLLDYTDVAPWPGTWRLVRSTDGGTTFQVVYTSPLVGSKTACIETDEDNKHPRSLQR